MSDTKRLTGVAGHILADRQHKNIWEDPAAPADYVAGPESGVDQLTYLPTHVLSVNLSGGSSGTRAFAVQNPYSVDALVQQVMLDIRTASSSLARLNIGLVSSSSKSATNLGDGIGVDRAVPVPVVVGGADRVWKAKGHSSDAWMTGVIQNGPAAGLAGRVIIVAVPLYST